MFRVRCTPTTFLLALLPVLAGGCRKPAEPAPLGAAAPSEPAAIATVHSAELPVKAATTWSIETVDVPTDRAVLLIAGEGANAKRPIVHIHGMCTEARSDLEVWGAGARAHGTILALEGDTACASGQGGRDWKGDTASLDKRIDAAIATVRTVRGIDLDGSEVLLVGESRGATRATALAVKRPEKYTGLVLVGAPEAPPVAELRSLKGVAYLASEKEPQAVIRRSEKSLEEAGLRARFWELDGAVHGQYGPNGAATMSEAVGFVMAR